MKGVVLAGGRGSRLRPCTDVINKHLLPVYDRPMIQYPISSLLEAGIEDVLIVTGEEHAGGFFKLLGSGRSLGARSLSYACQEGEGGIADALRLAREFASGERVVVMLGDNVLEKSIRPSVERFAAQPAGARVLVHEVPDPQRFGVANCDGEFVRSIVEKPSDPSSNLAVIGVYMYDAEVFDIIETMKPSNRGELEITDVNNVYAARGELFADPVEGWWVDAGTIESLHRASMFVAQERTGFGTRASSEAQAA